MTVKTGSAWAGTFVTLDATGALATPSTGPAGTLYVDGVANGATVTITGSNPYKFAVTLPSLTAGQRVDMYITATISSIATAGVVASAQADTVLVSDVKTETAAILEDTGTTLDGLIKDVPTVSEFEARTKPAADYFDPTADTVANVTAVGTTTNLTNLPAMPADWLTAAGVKADAVTKLQANLALEATLTAIKGAGWTTESLKVIRDALTAVQADLDNPNQYKADVSALATTTHLQEVEDKVDTVDTVADAIKLKTDTIPASLAQAGEYTAAIAALQADLDNPNQYKADVSGLATATDLATVDGIVDAIKAKTDLIPASPASAGEYTAAIGAIPTAPLLAANYVAPDNASVGAIKTKTDQLVFTTPNKVDASATIDPTGLATSAALATVDGIVDAIKLQTDQLTFTVANKVDASATVDPTGIATSAEMAALDDKVDAIKAKTDNLPASPAATGAAMTLTAAYDKAKDDVLTPLGVVDGIVDAIKAKSDLIPATPAATGEYDADVTQIVELLYTILGGEGWTDETLVTIQAAIDAIKAKTDSIPASPAVAGEYTASIAAIQADLDNPDQYKADVSGIPDAILAKGIVGTMTLEQVLKVLAAVEIGITTGGGTETIVYTGIDGTIIRLTGVDENGNRTAVIVTPGA
jgi:hypothetical protein